MLPVLLGILRKKIMEGQLQYFSQFGLSKQHIHYVVILWNHKEGLTQKEIIEFAHFDKAHASRALKELIDKNLIEKEDKKTYKNKYFLTKEGSEIAEKTKQNNHQIFEEIFSVLTEDEQKQLESILKKVTDHIT